MNPKHQKITTYSKQLDNSVKIEQKSYYEKLSQEITEVEKHIPTTMSTLEQDVIKSLAHIFDEQTPQLVLTLKLTNDKPTLTKRWVTNRQNYPRQ